MWVLSRGYTWHRHVDRRERLRGAEVTRGADVTYSSILFIFLNMYRSPVYGETNFQYPLTVVCNIVSIFFISSMWD